MLTVRPRASRQRVMCRPWKFQKTAVVFSGAERRGRDFTLEFYLIPGKRATTKQLHFKEVVISKSSWKACLRACNNSLSLSATHACGVRTHVYSRNSRRCFLFAGKDSVTADEEAGDSTRHNCHPVSKQLLLLSSPEPARDGMTALTVTSVAFVALEPCQYSR